MSSLVSPLLRDMNTYEREAVITRIRLEMEDMAV